MPVIFGATTVLSGHGTWTYPDVGLVIGLLMQVASTGPANKQWGTEIIRFRDLGVYAPITEAGKMNAQPVFNDELVTYDLGHGPVGLAYDLNDGVTVDVTEILSETPPSGGGGSDLHATVIWDQSVPTPLPPGTPQQMLPDIQHIATNPTVLDYHTPSGVIVHEHGIYAVSAQAWFEDFTDGDELLLYVYRNGSSMWNDSGRSFAFSSGGNIETNIIWEFAIGDVIEIYAQQSGTSTPDVWPQFEVSLLEALP